LIKKVFLTFEHSHYTKLYRSAPIPHFLDPILGTKPIQDKTESVEHHGPPHVHKDEEFKDYQEWDQHVCLDIHVMFNDCSIVTSCMRIFINC